jgi:dTDP-D-glucose 4,6-dehydratase
MAAQAHVGRSFDTPHATALVTGIGALNMLEAMRKLVAPLPRLRGFFRLHRLNYTVIPRSLRKTKRRRSSREVLMLWGGEIVRM